MQLDRQVLSPDEKELPGAGTQASKQFSLIFYRQWISIGGRGSEERDGPGAPTYTDQSTSIGHGRFLLQLQHDGILDVLGGLGGRSARAGTE